MLPKQRSQILRRQNLPSGVLQQLFEDAAQKSPKALEEILYLFLQQPYTPEVVLTALSQWDTDAIRADLLTSNKPFEVSKTIEDRISDRLNYLAQVACHPNVSLPILERLAQCPNPRVRLAVAQNPLTPNRLRCQLLEDLSTYPEQWIQVQVASNPNTPISVLAAMAQSEMYQPKLLREIRRTIASEYLPDAHSYKSTADHMMSFIKHKILTPAGLVVDVDRWMEIVESSDLLAAMADSSNSQDLQSSFWCDRLAFRCTDLLPGLDEQSLQRVVGHFCEILGMVNYSVKNDSDERAVARFQLNSASENI